MSHDYESKENEENFQPKYKKEIFVVNPTGSGGKRKVEIEYKEIRPGVWEKIPGTKTDLGPVNKNAPDKIQ